MILSFHYARDLAQGLRDGHCGSWDVDLHMDVSGREARPATNGAARAVGGGREIDVLRVRQQ
jgi:hypothetical protein